MKKPEIINGTLVIDRWFPQYGTGIIKNVKRLCLQLILLVKLVKLNMNMLMHNILKKFNYDRIA